MTGNIGRPGTGANSITGQCNAMGSRLFSNTTNLLGGHDFTNADAPPEGRRRPGHRRGAHPARASLAYDQIIEGILAGKINGLWVVATNPAHSWINQADARDDPGRGSTSWSCRTCTPRPRPPRQAHLVLPAAGWGEKEGTFINSERRFGLLKKVARAPGQALADFYIFKLVAEAWGCGDMFRALDEPRGGVPDPEGAVARPALRHHRHQRLRHARRSPAASSGRSPRGRTSPPQAERRCSRTASSSTPTARPSFIFEAPRAMPEPTDDRLPASRCSPAAAARASGTPRPAPRSRRVLRKLYPARDLRRDQPRRRARPEGRAATSGSIVESRRGEMRARAHADPRRATGPGLHADALRRVQPARRSPPSIRTRASRRTSTAPCGSAKRAKRRSELLLTRGRGSLLAAPLNPPLAAPRDAFKSVAISKCEPLRRRLPDFTLRAAPPAFRAAPRPGTQRR